jgi:immunoglobulin-binding protein 1
MEKSIEEIELVRRKIEKFEDEGGPYDQEELKNILNICSKIIKEVHSNGLFSTNEEFNEVKTEDIKYLLVPYYQSDILQKFMENRESKLDLSLKFYDEFFKVLNNYGYFQKEKKKLYLNLRKKDDEEVDNESDKDINKKSNIELVSQNREEKIQAYKYKKALSNRLKVKYFSLIIK